MLGRGRREKEEKLEGEKSEKVKKVRKSVKMSESFAKRVCNLFPGCSQCCRALISGNRTPAPPPV
jgi:hypothetical protein